MDSKRHRKSKPKVVERSSQVFRKCYNNLIYIFIRVSLDN